MKPVNIAMYDESESRQTRFSNKSDSYNQSTDQIANVLYATGSDLLCAYGEKILGSNSSDYVPTNINISRYISVNPRYYFQVNDDYVKTKLKLILFPFLHKGHWMRTMEPGGGKFTFKPPMHDINAPDLYIPMMAFLTYVLLAGFFLGINGKFSPESLGVQFSTGLMCWLMQVLLLEGTLHSLLGVGGGEIVVPLLDVVSYAGYTFVGAAVVMAVRVFAHRIVWENGYLLFCVVALWESFCMGVLLVKIVKRILVSEVPSFGKKYSTNKRNYVLLFVAVAQNPLLFWLGNVVAVEC